MTFAVNYYQKYLGSAKINIKKAVAGSLINCLLTYTVGETGIDEGGALKVLFRISSDISDAQFINPYKDNYVKIFPNNKNVSLQGYSRSNGAKGKIHERPWINGFLIFVSGSYLSPGEKIFIQFKNWRAQTFIEDTFEFKFVVDPFATGRYFELPINPTIKILSGKPNKLVIITPTTVFKKEFFNVFLKLEDGWGNPCINANGIVKITPNSNFSHLPKTIALNQGISEFKTSVVEKEPAYITATYNNIYTQSNPLIVLKQSDYKHYWADLHGQSEETVGTNSLENYLTFAKKYGKLDIACTQPNDFEVSGSIWEKINTLAKKNSEKNKFIIFPGFEWSGNTDKGGDRNVIYEKENYPIYRSSHALLTDFSDVNSDCTTVQDLFNNLKSKKALTIAHVGGRYSNLNMHDDYIEKAVEVHSNWGTFEWFLFEALEKNYKVGVVANSDTHNGRPGASYPGLEEVFNSYGGLTCILSKQLDRKTIFKSLLSRHFYATTGARIFINTQFLYKNKLLGIMGDQLKTGGMPDKIIITSVGTSFIEKIELFNKSRLIKVFYTPLQTIKNKDAIKITWSGTILNIGKNRLYQWIGDINIEDNEVEKIENVQIYEKNSIIVKNNNISIKTRTSGNTQGFILKLNKSGGKCNLNFNQKKIKLNINEITNTEKTLFFESSFNKLSINKTLYEDKPNSLLMSHIFQKKDLEKNNAIFVKVTQRDSHMAWTSPFFFQLK
ncbi:hypothetical protein A3A46_02335 [Candidatus Roizmanbacteria bacterium RIFCSPLOWO2_01_FULL_37_13]|uniref:DUF3604 domain-containing protein n=1 Tax=Candidatus Roizmanbacteria bacterium RIFCSPHIGHO2_02_FULL_38_11 TaxID=1802039 RepID=A0A1F7H1X6_9BACT|nr:MAG: hypothetical protein A3C25_03735 [Candidatus Roizmanbacteria bacterium RIFCSPHIGHO2_02_FULL_38_11]OGK35308.1 MAG: hypothetical protein A3F58_03390 [Candidatus Roizmanbacteria bacterium RIFCSPHIGHO2_12_FULL_37_9b]OGK41416.1 MAG: hypothetical protein A3A46_02335 [Candidatus Roizmanbacteria bacterium RIFCSPLOWO2_01_FULL_37_13]